MSSRLPALALLLSLALLAACSTPLPPNTHKTEVKKVGDALHSLYRDPVPGSTHIVLRCEAASTGSCVLVQREPGRTELTLKRLAPGQEFKPALAPHEFVYCVQPLVPAFPLQVSCVPKAAQMQ